ncbi:DUF3311 domain-containing protein [Pseudonocardia zijingensis]|uniref:DUF3311 domain-containing protein n=1 Tax=Pseudonocardia zijingensis TaxID=153376 RepID=A0ABP3YXR9_9PSEU
MPDDEVQRGPVTRTPRHHWWLLALPFLWCIAAVPFVNQKAYVWGSVPFLLVWMTAGVLVGSAAIGVVFAIDSRRGDAERV